MTDQSNTSAAFGQSLRQTPPKCDTCGRQGEVWANGRCPDCTQLPSPSASAEQNRRRPVDGDLREGPKTVGERLHDRHCPAGRKPKAIEPRIIRDPLEGPPRTQGQMVSDHEADLMAARDGYNPW